METLAITPSKSCSKMLCIAMYVAKMVILTHIYFHSMSVNENQYNKY